uniref:Envelope fusion protein n=1 Tax=Megaselia scalaris TaxID=36166 RepID=T1GHD8_MEGSC
MMKCFLIALQITASMAVIQPQSSSGIFYEYLGTVKPYHDEASLKFYINLTEYRVLFENISQQSSETKMLCNKIDELFCKYEICSKPKKSYNCNQFLEDIFRDLKIMNESLSFFTPIEPANQRSKRSLLDGASSLLKFVIGTPTEEDTAYYSEQIKTLQGRSKILNEVNDKTSTLLSEIFETYSNLTKNLQNNLEVALSHNFGEMEKFVNKTIDREKIIQKSTELDSKMKFLSSHVGQMRSQLSKILNALSFAENGVLHTPLITPKQFLELLKESELPIVIDESFELFQVYSFPIIAIDGNVAKIDPSNKYYIFSKDNSEFSPLDLEKCKLLVDNNWVCLLKEMTSNSNDSDICEVALRNGDASKCNMLLLKINLFIVFPLQNNEWLIMTTNAENYIDSCEGKGKINPGNYKVSLKSGCSFKIGKKELLATNIIGKEKVFHEFPEVEILDKSNFTKYLRDNIKEFSFENITLIENIKSWEDLSKNITKAIQDRKEIQVHYAKQEVWKMVIISLFGSLILISVIYFVIKPIYKRRKELQKSKLNYKEQLLENTNSINSKEKLEENVKNKGDLLTILKKEKDIALV